MYRQTGALRGPLIISLLLHLAILMGAAVRIAPEIAAQAPIRAFLAEGPAREAAAPRTLAPETKVLAAATPVKQPRLAATGNATPELRAVSADASPPVAGGQVADSAMVPGPGPLAPEVAAALKPVAEGISPDGLRQYRLALAREARRLKRYPPLARERGWEGTVQVTAAFGAAIPDVVLDHSSGYPLLDEQALLMISRAVQLAELPESLRGRSFRLVIPVQFSLAD